MSVSLDDFEFKRVYRGQIKAVIFDLSGTLVDPFACAPTIVFQKVLEKWGITLPVSKCRMPMGKPKDIHLGILLNLPEAQEQWRKKTGRPPNREDIDLMYRDYIPMQIDCIKNLYNQIPPGAPEAYKWCKENKLKIGVTTDYSRKVTDLIINQLMNSDNEIIIDSHVACDDSNVDGHDTDGNSWGQRPYPCMIWENMKELGIYQSEAIIKIDDTVEGIAEALNAKCWAIGVAGYSNYMNINSAEEYERMEAAELNRRMQSTRDRLRQAGAHYVINTLADLPVVIRAINVRLANGNAP